MLGFKQKSCLDADIHKQMVGILMEKKKKSTQKYWCVVCACLVSAYRSNESVTRNDVSDKMVNLVYEVE